MAWNDTKAMLDLWSSAEYNDLVDCLMRISGNAVFTSGNYFAHSSNKTIHYPSSSLEDWFDSKYSPSGSSAVTWAILSNGTGIQSFTVGVSGSDASVSVEFGKTSTTVASGSHTHDSRYYTEEESNGLFFPSSLGHSHITNVNNPHHVSGSQVKIDNLAGATYDNIQDFIDDILSAGIITGGNITDNGDGTVSVSAGTGFIKTSNSDVGNTIFFDWNSNSSVSLTNNSDNYIYVDYNGGSPTISVSTTIPPDTNTKIILGEVYREGTNLHIVSAGQEISNYQHKVFWKDIDTNGKFQRVSGIIISEKTNRRFAITSGYIYAGLKKITTSSFDSSSGDTFTYYWRDGSGGWNTSTGNTQIDNQHYDDGSGTLAELSDPTWFQSYYGVHWVYMDADSHVLVLYGRGDYTLSEAENATPPSDVPPLIEAMGGLVGKIIIEKNANSFQDIKSAFENQFSPSVVSDHNELGGLQGGSTNEYYHLSAAQHTIATQPATPTQDGYLLSSNFIYFSSKQDAINFGILSNGVGIQSFSAGISGSDATVSVKGYNNISGNASSGQRALEWLSSSSSTYITRTTFNTPLVGLYGQKALILGRFQTPSGKEVKLWQASAADMSGNSIGYLEIQLLSGSSKIYTTSSSTVKIGSPLATTGGDIVIRLAYSSNTSSFPSTGSVVYGTGFMNISIE